MTPVICEAPEPQLHAGLDKLVRMGAPYLPFSSCLGVMSRFCCLLGTSCPHLSRPVLRTFIHVPLAGPGATWAGAAGSYDVELNTVMTCSPVCLVYFLSGFSLETPRLRVLCHKLKSSLTLSTVIGLPGAGMKMPTGGNHTSTQDSCAVCCAPTLSTGTLWAHRPPAGPGS